MKNRIALYMICAIAVGYLLVSAVPSQVAIYTQPKLLTAGSDGEEMLSTPPTLETDNGARGNLTSPEFDIEIAEDTPLAPVKPTRTLGNSLIGLSKWWIVDLFIALSIYLVARKFLV
jgi:hypothetical protein